MPARTTTITRFDSRRRAIIAIATFLLISVLVIRTSDAAFTASHVNPDNEFATANIDLTSPTSVPIFGDGGSASLVDASNLFPNNAVSACINITYTGSLDASDLESVELSVSGAPTGSLADDLDLTVAVRDDACGAGTVDATPINGSALSSIATSDSGWTPGTDNETRGFDFSVVLTDDDVQGADLSGVSFTWNLESSS